MIAKIWNREKLLNLIKSNIKIKKLEKDRLQNRFDINNVS